MLLVGPGALLKEKTYEESMGMFSRSSFSNGLLPERTNCYFTHDWSTDELQRLVSSLELWPPIPHFLITRYFMIILVILTFSGTSNTEP